ncbi:hypothetical protein V8E54_001486 [Elaphomyces granulatus]
MKVLVAPNEDEFERLPPALRRKFFSNLELFRLEQLRLRQNCHQNGRRYRPGRSAGPVHHTPLSCRKARARIASSSRSPSLCKQILGHLRRPVDLQRTSLNYQEDWRCFHSLPQKIQLSRFSQEERTRFQSCCECGIVDAADEAVYKLEQQLKAAQSHRHWPSNSPKLSPRSSMLSSTSSERPADSAIDMDDSFYDSFRWLDEGDLDLTLDVGHSSPADDHKVSPTPSSPRRKPSFRRTFSFTSTHQTPTSNAIKRARNLSLSSNIPFPIASHFHRPSTSRRFSIQPTPRHVSQRSTSSIDPSAQYYQDPEARLKLRVYLASPQKFDEAIEFGFPSLENKENIVPKRVSGPQKVSNWQTYMSPHTFLEDDTPSVGEDATEGNDEKDDPDELIRGGSLRDHSFDLPPLQPLHSLCVVGRPREMTLKMTLTRPDLRTADPLYPNNKDQLGLADILPAESSPRIWDSPSDEQGVMRKIWHKFRKRRD